MKLAFILLSLFIINAAAENVTTVTPTPVPISEVVQPVQPQVPVPFPSSVVVPGVSGTGILPGAGIVSGTGLQPGAGIVPGTGIQPVILPGMVQGSGILPGMVQGSGILPGVVQGTVPVSPIVQPSQIIPGPYPFVPGVLPPYYQMSSYCHQMIRTPGYPYPFYLFPTDQASVIAYMDYFILPQYRTLWYHTCYLPTRKFYTSGYWFNGAMNVAGDAFYGGLNVANTAFTSANNILGRVGQQFFNLNNNFNNLNK